MSRRDTVSSTDHWIIFNKSNGSSTPLTRELVFVGKSDCDIVLNSSSVDKRHAVISFSPQEGLFYIKDLNTSHGTFVNDWKIPGQTYIKLEHLNKLRFGFSSDVFTICKADSCPQATRTPTPAAGPSAQSGPSGAVIQPKIIHPQPLLDPNQESPAVVRQLLRKKHTSSTIFPLPFCSDDYKPPPKPLVEKKKPETVVESSTSVAAAAEKIEESRCQLPQESAMSNPVAPCSNSPASESIDTDFSSKKFSAIRMKTKKPSFVKEKEEEPVPQVPPAPPTFFTISFDEGPKKCGPPKLSSMDRPPKSDGKKGVESLKNRTPDQKTSPISESAAYLINRMLQSQESESDLDRQSPISESERGLDSGVCDDRSECGTYTLQSEKKDADVEKARKMIDDVFGIKDYVNKIKISPDSSPECSTPSNSIVRNSSPAGSDSVDKQKTFSRNKEAGAERASQRRGRPRSKISDQMTMSAIECRQKNDSPSRSASSSRTVEMKRDSKLSPLVNRKYLYNRSKSNLSVASNESEPASMNSNHYKSDSNTASSLKLNRAFALRRARLGIETPGVPLNLSSEKPPKVPSHLSRSDGGRFSLRAGRGSVGSLCSAPSSRKNVKDDHRRSTQGLQARVKTCSDTERAYRSLHDSINKSLAIKSKQVSDAECSQSRNSVPGIRTSFGGRGLQAVNSSRNKQQANVVPIKRQETEQMSVSMIETRTSEAISRTPRSSQRIMSALDNLVLAAIMQLSSKLKRGMCEFLEKEQRKYPRGSDTRMMIEEILPQVGADDTRLPDNSSESPSKELSNILKNLKKVEQSLEGKVIDISLKS